jgi:hypothetical protein
MKHVVCHRYLDPLSLAAEGHLKEEDGCGFTELVYLYFRALFSLAVEGHLKEEDGRGFTELLYLPDLQALLLGLSNSSLLQAHHLLHSISSIIRVFFQN